MKCSIKRGLLDAYKRLMRNGDEGGVWDIIRHQEWRKNDVSTKSGCCSSLQQLRAPILLPWKAVSKQTILVLVHLEPVREPLRGNHS